MKIIIEKQFDCYCDDWHIHAKMLIDYNIYYHIGKDENTITILEQSIQLPENKMEKFLDFIHFHTDNLIILERYETGRYTLKYSNTKEN